VETQNWRMVAAPPGISDADKATLVDTVQKMAESDPWKNIVSQKGWANTFLAGADFETYLSGEVEKTTAILKQLGIAQ
jgi:putative tricarboxylic transport membrane protein